MIILISRDVDIYRQLFSRLRRLSCCYLSWDAVLFRIEKWIF